MTEEGKYIYSIIKENKDRRFGSIGITNREVKLVPYKDIAAVVSNTPVINFDRLNKKELTGYVATHQKVNEVVMREYDVVPMTFGIIAPSLDEVWRILEKVYFQFKTALKNIAGKAEFAVQVWWDPKKLLEDLANTDLEIQKLREAISSKRGILALSTKLKLGKLIQKKAEIRRQTFINDVHGFLRNLSFDSTSNKLIDDVCPVGSQRPSFGEMIANFSFLIEKTKESELDKKMQELGKKYEGKLRFKYIGPMPPYSFVKINLSLGNFELIDNARKILGLKEEASLLEIKQAYYNLAREYHPDKHAGSAEAEEKTKEIIQAYEILENYCRSCDSTRTNAEDYTEQRGSRKYSFRKEDVENSIMIKYA